MAGSLPLVPILTQSKQAEGKTTKEMMVTRCKDAEYSRV
jgi:hypothetical protein